METIIDILESETEGTCYKSFRYCADEELRIPTLKYDETQPFSIKKNQYGENSPEKETKPLAGLAAKLFDNEPLFRFFLDGSRRTYKIDDIEKNKRVYPIMAGQIGVACCERKSKGQFACVELENNLVLSLPTISNPNVKNSEEFFNSLTNKINQTKRIL